MPLTDLLKEQVERQASDLHLVPGSPPTLRIWGQLTPISEDAPVLGSDEVATLFEPFLTEAQRAALRDKQDINIGMAAVGVYFRVCLFSERHGLGASLRLIPAQIPTLEELFSGETLALFRGLTQVRRGLILVVGAVGSGKSTTTASMIDCINAERSERIFTIEHPLEYIHTSKRSLISQREVGTDVDSYEQGSFSVMRADPDVILVGELSTPDALRIALALADSGHLVFSTMLATSASEAVRRMMESFPESRETIRQMIARSLQAVITQRLATRASTSERGHRRVAVHEIMLVNARIRRMIDAGETDLSLAIEAGRDEGMRTMDDSLLQLYRDGIITYELAWGSVQDRDRLGPKSVDPA